MNIIIAAGFLALASASAVSARQAPLGDPPNYVTPRESIVERIGSGIGGGRLPPLLQAGLGVTHVAGRYHFTDQPFLIEGARRVLNLGYSSLKLWFAKPAEAYPFNSDWSALGANPTYLDRSSAEREPGLEMQNFACGRGEPGDGRVEEYPHPDQ